MIALFPNCKNLYQSPKVLTAICLKSFQVFWYSGILCFQYILNIQKKRFANFNF